MVHRNSMLPARMWTALLMPLLLLWGCTGQQTATKDPFFEKWTTMAETSTGRSPAPRQKPSLMMPELGSGAEGKEEGLTVIPLKELPTQPVTLKFRQADIQTVLRSLARIVGRNVLVKSEIKGEMTIDFKEVPWNQAFTSILRTHGLTYTWEGDILRVLTFEDRELDLKRRTQEMGVKWVEPLQTIVVPIDYAKPKDMKENLESFLTRTKEDKPRGSIRVDEHSNSLIISAIRDDLVRMMPIIEKIDRPTPQIQIKANIIETTKNTARELGIQWGGIYGRRVGDNSLFLTPGGTKGSTTPPGSALSGGYTPATGDPGISGQGFGVNFPGASVANTTGAASLGLMFGTIGGNLLELQLRALQQDGKIHILSSPSITTLDNQKAFTENGERVPYSTLDTTVTPPIRTVKFEDVVLRLEITPHVIDGQNLLMKILVKKDEVDDSRKVDGNPYIFKKQTDTTLIVRDGETIVISGLTKQKGTNIEDGVPGLKDIPVLGWLFKGEGKSDEMQEVLIFITPRILPTLSMTGNKTDSGTALPATTP